MRREVLARHRDLLAPEDEEAKLARLLKKVGAVRRQEARDPYRLLAALPARVFITATPDSLLTEALIEAGKRPEERIAFWKRGLPPPEPYDKEPTVGAPLVYHMLGHFKEPDSLVLTQDDHLDYLIGASRNNALVPNVVGHALIGSTLLFLGFQLTDWSFRVLFRLIKSPEGANLAQTLPPCRGPGGPGGQSAHRRRGGAPVPDGQLRQRRHQPLLGQQRGISPAACPQAAGAHPRAMGPAGSRRR